MSEGRPTLFVTRPLSGRAKRRRQRRRGKRSEQKRFKYAWPAKAGKKSRQDGTELCSSRVGGGGKDHRNGSDNYVLAREKVRNFLVKQTSGVSARRSTEPQLRPRGARRPEESCIARALLSSVRHIAVCVHAATSSKSCISGCVLLPHTCYGLSALNLSPEAPLHIAERISQRG